jgi:hypothetical protein
MLVFGRLIGVVENCLRDFVSGDSLRLDLGEHYFVDLVATRSVCADDSGRPRAEASHHRRAQVGPFLTGLVLMLGWVILLRWGCR